MDNSEGIRLRRIRGVSREPEIREEFFFLNRKSSFCKSSGLEVCLFNHTVEKKCSCE